MVIYFMFKIRNKNILPNSNSYHPLVLFVSFHHVKKERWRINIPLYCFVVKMFEQILLLRDHYLIILSQFTKKFLFDKMIIFWKAKEGNQLYRSTYIPQRHIQLFRTKYFSLIFYFFFVYYFISKLNKFESHVVLNVDDKFSRQLNLQLVV